MRVLRTQFNEEFTSRNEEINELLNKGVIPIQHLISEAEEKVKKGEMKMPSAAEMAAMRPLLMGQCAGAIHDVLSARQIIDDMIKVALQTIHTVEGNVIKISKL